MGPVLALHLAERSGWAFWHDDGRVESGRLKLPQPSLGDGLARFRAWLQERLGKTPCSGLAFEAPWDGPRCGREQARQLIGLASVAEMTARERGHYYYAQGNYELMLAEFSKDLFLNKDDPKAMNNVGVAYAVLGHAELARTMWKRALKANPGR